MNPKIFTRIFLLLTLSGALACSCRNRTASNPGAVPDAGEASPSEPVQYSYIIKNTYPHDERAYTQGLFWHKGHLWESTGQYGYSSMRQVKLETGEPLQVHNMERKFFGEGATLHNGEIYQLTWENGTAFVYDPKGLRAVRQLRYGGQGWGITSDGENLYMSDGSHEITVRDAETFAVKSVIRVMNGNRRLRMINELEWIDGKIWANVYLSDFIVIIDPQSGQVTAVVDLQGILPEAERTPDTDVLNGIAYDAHGGRIFVTGKNWPRLFEIELVEKK